MIENAPREEIAKFEALAKRWWDKNSEFKPLHDINPLRSNFIDQHSPVAELKVLDVGCGGGILCEALAQKYVRVLVTGMEKDRNSFRKLLGMVNSKPAVAAADCFKDCFSNCKKIAPQNEAYCRDQCTDYCAQDDRQDGLSGSVSSNGGK